MPDKKSDAAPTLLWFRRDLRLEDNSALQAAIKRGEPIVPVYIWAPEEEGEWPLGAAAQWWLHQALEDLASKFTDAGLTLILRKGESLKMLRELAEETGAGAVFWNRRYEPVIRERDGKIKKALGDDGMEARSFQSHVIFEPHSIENKSGKPFQVFSPFWRACQTHDFPEPPTIDLKKARGLKDSPKSDPLEDLGLLPEKKWDDGIAAFWDPTLDGAEKQLATFLESGVRDYGDTRNRPDIDGSSRLSPYLAHGQLGPRQIVARVYEVGDQRAKGIKKFVDEIGWREFSYHLLYHFPDTPEQPLRPEFEHFPWDDDKDLLKAWRKGRTGYPLVDAGMRQLWKVGWMHNRTRMNVASLLVKHLLLPWQEGARWFWDCLVDADLANNTQGWQWAGGCGADAAPYFRIFNPMMQGERYDPKGDYIREYVPELKDLPQSVIHQPWEASDEELSEAGVTLGETYPKPIIDHKAGRERALEAFEKLKERRSA
ncbi:MAG: cryptochrome/photolyase family protein [Opitutales bacterium]